MRGGLYGVTWAFIGPREDLIPWVIADIPRRVQAAWEETGPDAGFRSGGAKGVDTLARVAWEALPGATKPDERKPKYDRRMGYAYNARKALERNDEVVAVDRVVAWWNGKSRGTRDAMKKAWDLGSLWEVRFFNQVIWSRGMPWNPFDYGKWMAEHMYKSTQLTYAALLLKKQIERSTRLSSTQVEQYCLRVTEGQHWLERGNRPTKEADGSLHFPVMKKADRDKLEVEGEPQRGHTVNLGQECTCEAGQHGRPCWARGAAWIVRHVESYQQVGVVPNMDELETEFLQELAA